MMGKEYEEIKNNKGCLSVVSNRKKLNVPIDAIDYLESRGRKIILHLEQKEISFYAKISDVADSFLENGFVRIHQSFMVRKNKIQNVSRNCVEYGDLILPVSRRYYVEIRKITEE